MENNNTLGKIRKEALHHWLESTNRKVVFYPDAKLPPYEITLDTIILPDMLKSGIVTDIFYESPECKYQTADGVEDFHVSYFCSIGDWASNITDMLLDDRYDNLDYDSEEDLACTIFRYYTRMLLLVSEMVEDFTDLLCHLDIHRGIRKKDKKIYRRMFGNITPDLMGYINTVCKHKYENVHACNHHLSLYFEDSNQPTNFKNPIKLGLSSGHTSQPDGIIVPKLGDILAIVINGYRILDGLLLENDGKPTKLLEDFSKAVGIKGNF
ncbi:MAG: hypothetical protein KJ064_06280 [Anaerolineae bacterium]|nr:hypothetical protein [Anaerolineae bacterium]